MAIWWISDSKTYSVIHWIEIYLVDSVIQSLNNQGQVSLQMIDVNLFLCV